jgi:molecular chaperone DnaJ
MTGTTSICSLQPTLAVVQISYIDAILGTTIKVTTVDGPVELKIPPGTQPGTTLLMKGRGAPSPVSRTAQRGNHLVKVKVTIPKKVDSKERELMEKLRELQSDHKIHVGPFSF